jgi:signal transduction histidine kinase
MTQAEQDGVIQNQQLMVQLLREREAIVKSGRLHWFHWLVIALSLVVTFGAWHFTKQQIEEKTKNQYERASKQVLELVSERMQKYEDGLWGGVSAIQAHGGDIKYEDWRVFADSLRIDVKYPGISGIGVIKHIAPENVEAYLAKQRLSRPDFHIHPKHNKSEYLPITYIEPSGVNAKAVGLDMAHETNRYTAALKARDTGTAQITGPIVLVQDAGRTPGFLFYAPYYSGGKYKTAQDRHSHFMGMVYAPFVFHKLMEGVLKKENRHIWIRVKDSKDLLYDEHIESEQEFDPNPLFASEVDLNLYGRTWTFEIQTTNSFRAANSSDQPSIILAGGILIDSLLYTLFVLLSRANRKAVSFADRMTGELKNKANALEVSEGKLAGSVDDLQRANADLKRFAYVASHDLQEPLRKLQQFSDFLAKDCADQLSKDGKYFLDVIQGSSSRMSHLIRDLLAYSRTSNRDLEPREVDLSALTSSVLSELDVSISESKSSIQVDALPTIVGDPGSIEHLMRNLIGNAIKYRHPEREPQITITSPVLSKGSASEIHVADNGIGFDMKYCERIFEPFQRLHNKHEFAGSGIGLAVCNTICERHGWKLQANSKVGQGSTFSVIIPSTDAP